MYATRFIENIQLPICLLDYLLWYYFLCRLHSKLNHVITNYIGRPSYLVWIPQNRVYMDICINWTSWYVTILKKGLNICQMCNQKPYIKTQTIQFQLLKKKGQNTNNGLQEHTWKTKDLVTLKPTPVFKIRW